MGIQIDLVIGTVPDDLQCAICKSLLLDAVTVKGCQNNYCRICLDKLVYNEEFKCNKLYPRCPECRESFSLQTDVMEFQFIRNRLSELKIKCPEIDCAAEVMYDNFGAHSSQCGIDLTKYNCNHCAKDLPPHLVEV